MPGRVYEWKSRNACRSGIASGSKDRMTHGSLSADASSPRWRGVSYAKVFLLTIRTASGFRDKVSWCGLRAFDLDETFCAKGLEAAS